MPQADPSPPQDRYGTRGRAMARKEGLCPKLKGNPNLPKKNPGAGRPRGSKDYSPKVRGAVLRAFKLLEERGTPLSVLLADALQEDVVRTLHGLAKFLPNTSLAQLEASADAQVVNIQVNLGPPPQGQEALPQAVRVETPAQDTPGEASPATGQHRPPGGT